MYSLSIQSVSNFYYKLLFLLDILIFIFFLIFVYIFINVDKLSNCLLVFFNNFQYYEKYIKLLNNKHLLTALWTEYTRFIKYQIQQEKH